MLKILRNKKAQNTAEYALMIAIVVGAFSIMQLYIKRGLQARIKDGVNNIPGIIANKSADALVMSSLFNGTDQYEPYYYRNATYDMSTTASEGTETGTIQADSSTDAVSGVRNLTDATTLRSGTQGVGGTSSAD